MQPWTMSLMAYYNEGSS